MGHRVQACVRVHASVYVGVCGCVPQRTRALCTCICSGMRTHVCVLCAPARSCVVVCVELGEAVGQLLSPSLSSCVHRVLGVCIVCLERACTCRGGVCLPAWGVLVCLECAHVRAGCAHVGIVCACRRGVCLERAGSCLRGVCLSVWSVLISAQGVLMFALGVPACMGCAWSAQAHVCVGCACLEGLECAHVCAGCAFVCAGCAHVCVCMSVWGVQNEYCVSKGSAWMALHLPFLSACATRCQVAGLPLPTPICCPEVSKVMA